MKHLIFLAILFGNLATLSQNLNLADGTTYAVVVGISDYQDDDIPDLKFAHRDASSFADWLASESGGSLPETHLRLLMNEEATNAQMLVSFDWLIEKSQPGDRVLIYFSGHGDVEHITKYNKGYLLGYDSPPKYYSIGAFPIDFLKDIISNLSDDGAQVILILDACRAGKLAGGNINGTQITASRLQQKFANEIKILSCQPDEYSLEGEQWGDGRGCFSYHLENALYGLADLNNDGQVNLLELRSYLEEKVSEAAEPDSQIPMVQGPPRHNVSLVNEALMATRRETLKRQEELFLSASQKNMEEKLFASVDSNIQLIYRKFQRALDSNHLLQPQGISANEYFEILISNPILEKYHGSIKRKFVVALLDKGQLFLNKMMKTDRQTLDKFWSGGLSYKLLPDYFKRASEILGENHYVFESLKAKEWYFKGKLIDKSKYPDLTYNQIYEKRIECYREAIQYDSTLAIAYWEIGRLYNWLGQRIKSAEYYEYTIKYAPNWALAHYFLGLCYYKIPGKNLESVRAFKNAMALDTIFLKSFYWIARPFDNMGMIDSAKFYRQKYVEKFFNIFYSNSQNITRGDINDAGNALWRLRRHEEAKDLLEHGANKYPEKFGGYLTLAEVYADLQEFDSAINAYEKYWEAFRNLEEYIEGHKGIVYHHYLKDSEKAEESFENLKTISLDYIQIQKIYFYYESEEFEKALTLVDTCLKVHPNNLSFSYLKAKVLQKLNEPQKANLYFQQIIDSAQVHLEPNFKFRPDYFYIALSHHELKNSNKLRGLIKQIEKGLLNDPWMHYYLALIYSNIYKKRKAILELNKATAMGWNSNPLSWIHGTLSDPFLNPIRKSNTFKRWVGKNFPRYSEIAIRR